MAVTLLGDGGWSTSTLGCPPLRDGFIVAKVGDRVKRDQLSSMTHHSFRGEPRTGRARLQSGQKQPSRSAPRSALSIVEGPERRRSRSDRPIAHSVASHEPEGPDFSRAKNSRHEAPPLCPEHRRRAGAKAQPKRPIYCLALVVACFSPSLNRAKSNTCVHSPAKHQQTHLSRPPIYIQDQQPTQNEPLN